MKPPMLLRQGDTLLGTLTVDDGDMPWWYGDFRPTADFEPFRPIFAAWSKAVEDQDETAMDTAYQAIEALDLVITRTDDPESITQFMLHIEDDRFRLRY